MPPTTSISARALQNDMGWQHRRAGWVIRLEAPGIVQSMSLKGRRLDNRATEQVFGHLKDEFLRDRK